MLSQIGSSRKAVDLCTFVFQELDKFPTIFAVAIQFCAAFPISWRLWLLRREVCQLVDAELAQFAHGQIRQLAGSYKVLVARKILDGGYDYAVQIVVLRFGGDPSQQVIKIALHANSTDRAGKRLQDADKTV